MNYTAHENTAAFYTLAWVSFAVSSIGTLLGVYYVDIDMVYKFFFIMSYLFTISSCMTLSKVVRDKHEASKIFNKIETVKTDEYLSKISEKGIKEVI